MPANGELVVVGQGYVGLPLAQEATRAGIRTTGLDLNEKIVRQLNSGVSHVDDLSDSDVSQMCSLGYTASTSPDKISRADVVIVCVPTPLATDGTPDMAYVESAMTMVAEHVRHGALVCLESTTYPGTTEELIRPIFEANGHKIGSDVFLAYSPERINPGDSVYGFRNTPKVIGGTTDACLKRGTEFYSRIVDLVVPVSGTREAEMTKLIENTYRHVNIALMNELAQASRGLGVDIIEAINAAKTKPFGYQAFYPGPGVGGHCIPIDPNYLSYTIKTQLGHPFRFVELAQEINNSMPSYVVTRISDILNEEGKALNGSRVLLLGVTYKSNIADQRESPAVPVGRLLEKRHARLQFHDPHVETWDLREGKHLTRVDDLDKSLAAADIVVLMQHHSQYEHINWDSLSCAILDTRGVLRASNCAHYL